ncbi:hypothetical protein [Polaribacter sp.]|uniref:hypothetical protein n=1 Tax=Polaribacter sp. TaxID=1920175 RepID=UPI003F6A90FB
MLHKKILKSVIFITLLNLNYSLNAQSNNFNKFSIGFTAGTTGLGGELATNISTKFNLRLVVSGFNYSDNGQEVDNSVTVGYEVDGKVNSIALLVDYFLFNNKFRLIGGIVRNQFEINGNAAAITPYVFDANRTFSPDRVGSVSAVVNYPNEYMPYLGLGYGNALSKGNALKLNLSLGLLYSGSPELIMQGTGLISPTINQVASLQQGLNEFGWYPMLNVGISYQLLKNQKK